MAKSNPLVKVLSKVVLGSFLLGSLPVSAVYADVEESIPVRASNESQPTLIGKYRLANPEELGKGIKMSVGSSLLHIPGDPENVFYSTADRGPNGEVKVGEEKRRTFPLDTYTPSIYKIEVVDGKINVLERISLKLANGTDPVTGTNLISGVSNLPKEDEVPYDETGQKQLAYDPYGLDLEGLAYNKNDDTFWLCDEYRPSLVQVKRDGTILQRLIPAGMAEKITDAPHVPIKDILPGIYSKRIQNRGFEGVSITPDGKWMYAIMQNSLANPDDNAGKNSRIMRIIKIDLTNLKVVAEFPYVADSAKNYDGLKQFDIVASDLYAINEHVLLIDERDKYAGEEAKLKKVYKLDLSKATSILGQYDEAKKGEPLLEQMDIDQLKEKGVVLAEKTEVLDMLKFDYPFEKVEGISLVNNHILAVINDNDFGIENTTQTNVATEMWMFEVGDITK